MPLPTDEKLLALSQELLHQFDAIFGLNPGFRPAHAKGTLLTGMFTPSANAASLTRAPHIANASTPVTVRFSDSSGIPLMPDTDPNATRTDAPSVSTLHRMFTPTSSLTRPMGFQPEQGKSFSNCCGHSQRATPKILQARLWRPFLARTPRRSPTCRCQSLRRRALRGKITSV